MKKIILLAIACVAAVVILAQKPIVGTLAPNFKAKDQDGKEVSLSQHRGKKIVLYFYPKDDTPGDKVDTKAHSKQILK